MFVPVIALALFSSTSGAAAAIKTPPREGGGLFFPAAVAPVLTPQAPQLAPAPPASVMAPASEAPILDAAPPQAPAATASLNALAPRDEAPRPETAAAAVFDGSGLTPGGDLSEEYHAARAEAKGAASLPPAELARLREHKVLIVPGFLSGAFIRLSQALGRDPKPWHYFGPQMRWLSELGVEHELVGVHTEQTSEHNGSIIEERVRASKKPVIILSHSKGGLDALDALLRLRQDGSLGKVRAWLPVQSPFLGSPGADRVAGNPALRFWVERFLEHSAIGGSRQSLLGMTTDRSRRLYEGRREEIADVLSRVPTVAFTSWKQARVADVLYELTGLGLSLNPFLRPKNFFSPLLGLTVIVKAVGETLTWLATKSDGLVPPDRARLPGMSFVEEEGVDHFVPFIDHGGPFDRLGFTKALLRLVLSRARH